MTAKKRTAIPLGVELARLERTNPTVGKAAREFEAMKQRVLEGRVHPLPCTDTTCHWHHEQADDVQQEG